MSDQVCLVVGSEIMGSNKYLWDFVQNCNSDKSHGNLFFFKNTLKSQKSKMFALL